MKIGCQTILWGRKIEDLRKVFAAIAECGFTCVEFAQRPKLLGGISSVRSLQILMEDYGLELVGLAGGTLRERMDFAGEARNFYLYIERFDVEEDPLINEAVRKGFNLALHPHLFKKVQRLRDAVGHLPEERKLYILPDTAHAKIVGDSLEEIFDIPENRIAAIHLKDWNEEYGRSSHRYARGFVELSEGIVGVGDFIARLKQKNYKSYLLFEQDSSRSDPAICLRKNAKWLTDQGIQLSPRTTLGNKSSYVSPSIVSKRYISAEKKAAFFSALLHATTKGLEGFFLAVAEALRKLIDCSYSSIWSSLAHKDMLCLLAISPEPPLEWRFDTSPSFDDALSRDTLDSPKVTRFDFKKHPELVGKSSNSKFLLGEKIAYMISIPALNSANPNHVRYIINLFFCEHPDFVDNEEEQDEEYQEIGDFVSMLADRVLDDSCAAAAGRVDSIATEPPGVESYLAGLRNVIKTTFSCEGMTIFLVNAARTKLEPVAGNEFLEWSHPDHFYRLKEGLTGHVWDANRFFVTREANQESPFYHGKSAEKVLSSRDECLLAPISKTNREVMGVVRCVNKAEVPNRTVATMFSDDDAAVLEAVLQAAAPRLEILQKHYHRVQVLSCFAKDIGSALKRLADSARDTIGGTKVECAAFGDLIEGMIANTALLKEVSGSGLVPKKEWVSLSDGILKKAQFDCRFLLKSRLESILFEQSMPDVYVDATLFRRLFYNLFVYGIKRVKPGGQPRINVVVKGRNASELVIIVRASNVDLEEEAPNNIFAEGFQGEVGLFLCREIARCHDGVIEVKPEGGLLLFNISLPAGSGHFKTLSANC